MRRVKPLRRALLALSVALLVVPATASAARPGVVSLDHTLTTAQLDALQQTGAKSALFYLSWRDFQPQAGPLAANFIQEYSDLIASLRARNIVPNFVVFNPPAWATRDDPDASGNEGLPPTTPGERDRMANFMQDLASLSGFKGKVGKYEIWNEVDDDDEKGTFWRQARAERPASYAALVNRLGPVIKAADPAAKVSLAPMVGGGHLNWLKSLYDAGIDKNAYDVIAVHVDTACLVTGPYEYYRENGLIGRYNFLGYRELRRLALANGDPKPFHLEMGWSTYTGTCERGSKAGQKPSGVPVETAARFLEEAFSCLAEDPYVETAEWFSLADSVQPSFPGSRELGSYGLFGTTFQPKDPLHSSYKRVAEAPNQDVRGEKCSDFTPPAITVFKPQPNQQFVGRLDLEASVSDGDGVGFATGTTNGRATFAFNGGQAIRHFGPAEIGDGKRFAVPQWFGSSKLPLGRHTVEIIAYDSFGNVSQVNIPVEKVRTLAATLTPRLVVGRASCKGRRCTIKGRVEKTAQDAVSIGGKVRVLWEVNRRGVWRKQSGGLAQAKDPFTFILKKAKYKGRWRVTVSYEGEAPWKPVKGKAVSFTVR